MRSRLALLVPLVCLTSLAAAATDLAPGAAAGSFSVNGQTVPIKYSYSYLQAPKTMEEGSDLVVLLSDQVLPEASLRDEDALLTLARSGKFTGVRIVVAPDGRDKSGMLFYKPMKVILSTGLYVHSDIEEFDGKTVSGQVTSGQAELLGQRWHYDLKFHARVFGE